MGPHLVFLGNTFPLILLELFPSDVVLRIEGRHRHPRVFQQPEVLPFLVAVDQNLGTPVREQLVRAADTGYSNQHNAEDISSAGAGCLAKPTNLSLLLLRQVGFSRSIQADFGSHLHFERVPSRGLASML